MSRLANIWTVLWVALVLGATPSVLGVGVDSARVLIYHRFEERSLPSTNVTLEQFRAHLAEIAAKNYTVIALDDLVDRLESGKPIPSGAVAITIDDAYLSFKEHAWPLLKARGWPATLFVSTDPVDAGAPGYLSWDDIRTMQAEGLAIGHHGASHIHMPQAGPARAAADIERATQRFEEELGESPKIFAYPFGEYDSDLQSYLENKGFKAAFAQYSAPASAHMPRFALPRFALNEKYAGMDRLRTIFGTKALPVSDILPRNPVLSADNNPPLFGFSVAPTVQSLRGLACYPSHMGQPAEIHFPSANRVEVRFEEPFPKGRARINCTMPSPDGGFYWLGAFFLVPGAEE